MIEMSCLFVAHSIPPPPETKDFEVSIDHDVTQTRDLVSRGIRPPPQGHEKSIEEFVRCNLGDEVFERNLGDEFFERLINPFCSGVYVGDPSQLSMEATFGKVWWLEQNGGSIIGGTFKAL
ncbi:Amine oxidase [Sesbania bispinosa]|nr:Amine oxidase [Sesbania bispinosa]